MDTPDDAANREPANAKSLAERVRFSIDQGRTPGLRLIDIEVIAGTVVLSGKVATFHQKQLASALAGKVAGVVEVMNRLDVDDGGNDGNVRRPIGLYRQRRTDGDAHPEAV